MRQISRQIMSFRCVSSANRLKLESLLLKAAQKEEYSEELQFVLKHYHNDFDASRLEAQLELLGVMFFSTTDELNPTLNDVKNQVCTFSPVQRTSLSEICTLLKLIYVTPAVSEPEIIYILSLSERSASVLPEIIYRGIGRGGT